LKTFFYGEGFSPPAFERTTGSESMVIFGGLVQTSQSNDLPVTNDFYELSFGTTELYGVPYQPIFFTPFRKIFCFCGV